MGFLDRLALAEAPWQEAARRPFDTDFFGLGGSGYPGGGYPLPPPGASGGQYPPAQPPQQYGRAQAGPRPRRPKEGRRQATPLRQIRPAAGARGRRAQGWRTAPRVGAGRTSVSRGRRPNRKS